MLKVRLLLITAIFWGLYVSVSAQRNVEKTSLYQRFSADISYGLPFYQGDFYSFFAQPLPYDGSLLGGMAQYNNNSISGSLLMPWKYNLSFRLKATQTVIYFTEALANVNFKNSMYDFSLLVQYNYTIKKFNMYMMAGIGYHVSSEAQLFDTIADTEAGKNSGQVQRLSTTVGLGFEYNVWRQFGVFLEGDWYFSGSDRFDGYNGFQAGQLERADEKSYFYRDQLITARSGIRVYFISNSTLIAERKFNQLSSSYYENPYDTSREERKPEDDLPEELRKLGVKKKLTGYSLEVNRVITIDELKRQKVSGEKVLPSLKEKFPNAAVELLLETNGFTIHIGGFGSLKEAKNARLSVLQFYNAANVRKH